MNDIYFNIIRQQACSITDIKKLLDKYKIENYTINDDLSVDVDGSVDISDKGLKYIPIKFGKVSRYFWCNNNKLISLVGAPKVVGIELNCGYNLLTNLVGSPKKIGSTFWCNNNKLTTFKGITKKIPGSLVVVHNNLTSLKHSPESIGGVFNLRENKIKNLKYIEKTNGQGGYLLEGNPINSLSELLKIKYFSSISLTIDAKYKYFKNKEFFEKLSEFCRNKTKKTETEKKHDIIIKYCDFYDKIKPIIEKEEMGSNVKKIKTDNSDVSGRKFI